MSNYFGPEDEDWLEDVVDSEDDVSSAWGDDSDDGFDWVSEVEDGGSSFDGDSEEGQGDWGTLDDDSEDRQSDWGTISDEDGDWSDCGEEVVESVGVGSALSLDSSKFSIRLGKVKFSELTYSNPLKEYREETFKGLTKSVGELGIVTPIHVMLTEGYSKYLEDESSYDFDGEKYLLLDGFRRVFAGVKVGLSECSAVVWEFKDPDLGRDVSVSLSLVLNKHQKHNWKEVWGMFQVLEMSDIINPSSLEYLLHLDSGDAMRLKDVMMSEYDEVKEELLEGKKSLQQAYNNLQKLRREEDRLMMEDMRGISVTETGEAVAESEEAPRLSDNEVREVLDLVNSSDTEFSDDNFGEWSGEDVPDNWQDRKNGDRIDENLRQSILERDHFTCQVSGFGKGLKPHYTRKLLRVHHIVFVQDGGTDSEENLLTLSGDIHDLLHIIVANNGKLGISKEEYDALDEATKEMYKKLMKYVNVALEAKERLGRKGSDEGYKSEKRDPFWNSL